MDNPSTVLKYINSAFMILKLTFAIALSYKQHFLIKERLIPNVSSISCIALFLN